MASARKNRHYKEKQARASRAIRAWNQVIEMVEEVAEMLEQIMICLMMKRNPERLLRGQGSSQRRLGGERVRSIVVVIVMIRAKRVGLEKDKETIRMTMTKVMARAVAMPMEVTSSHKCRPLSPRL